MLADRRTTRFEPGEPLETFMRTVILAPNLERLPPDEHAAFVHEVASRLPEPPSTTSG